MRQSDHLLLARNASREREFAVPSARARERLMRQVIVESANLCSGKACGRSWHAEPYPLSGLPAHCPRATRFTRSAPPAVRYVNGALDTVVNGTIQRCAQRGDMPCRIRRATHDTP